jgi:hypothetical protein
VRTMLDFLQPYGATNWMKSATNKIRMSEVAA